jgi:hypothetical protein
MLDFITKYVINPKAYLIFFGYLISAQKMFFLYMKKTPKGVYKYTFEYKKYFCNTNHTLKIQSIPSKIRAKCSKIGKPFGFRKKKRDLFNSCLSESDGDTRCNFFFLFLSLSIAFFFWLKTNHGD